MPEPSWTYDSAKKVYERLAPKPTPEPRRVTAAREAFERVQSREARDLVAAELIRSIPADVDPEAETRAILTLQAELDAADDAKAQDAVLKEVEQALAPERSATRDDRGPYVDDDGKLRSGDGRVVNDPERAADVLRTLAKSDHDAANAFLERLEETAPTLAADVVGHLSTGSDT